MGPDALDRFVVGLLALFVAVVALSYVSSRVALRTMGATPSRGASAVVPPGMIAPKGLRSYTAFALLFTVSACVVAAAFLLEPRSSPDLAVVQTAILAVVLVLLSKTVLFVAISPWHQVVTRRRQQRHPSTSSDAVRPPLVTVIIPAWNEAVGIRDALDSVAASDYRPLEIVVVNDGSTDGTHDAITEYLRAGRHGDVPICYVQKPNGGKASALNVGVERSNGDIIVTIDADSVVLPSTVGAFVDAMGDEGVMAAAGNIRVASDGKMLSVIQAVEYHLTFFQKRAEAMLNCLYIVGGAAAAYRRAVFTRSGMYNTGSITEDIDLSVRIHRDGGRIAYASEAVVVTEPAADVRSLVKQRIRWRRGRHATLRQNRALFFSRDPRHSRSLSWFALPYSVFTEIQLLLEPLLVGFIVAMCVWTHEYLNLVTMLSLIAFLALVPTMVELRGRSLVAAIAMLPVAWLLMLAAVLIEFRALIGSLTASIFGRTTSWQSWQRRGVGMLTGMTRAPMNAIFRNLKPQARKRRLGAVVSTPVVVAFFGGATALFYISAARGALFENPILWMALFIVGTDGALLALTIGRRFRPHQNIASEPELVTIIISAYGSEDVIQKTLEHALRHVPAQNVILVSDASPDATAEIGRLMGVRVIENRVNRRKAFNINRALRLVETPYVMVLDDDTFLSEQPLPTGLFDMGYSAVSFNVMPEAEPTFINQLQRFEYRRSMLFGRAVRSASGAISNVSGAIGLFRTSDLRQQAWHHSGQWGGEDLQRTMLVHLLTDGRGIAYCDQLIETEAPRRLRSLFKQRSRQWSMSTQELFGLSLRVVLSPRTHYLLKVERAYSIFVMLTDPLRVLLLPALVLNPRYAVILYLAYLPLDFVSWLRTGRRDSIWVVLAYPAYSFMRNIARFFAQFYWYRTKYDYIRNRRFHRVVSARNVLLEYGGALAAGVVCWVAAVAAISF